MDFLLPLWLPILLSAAAVWLVSLILSMALPHHKRDWIELPGSLAGSGGSEDGFMAYLRASEIKPGNYLFPDFRDPKSMKSEKVQKALNEGPVGHLSLWPTPLTMSGKMAGTFVVYLVASALIGYLTRVAIHAAPDVASSSLPPASFAKVFQIAATGGVLAYCFSFIPSALWWGSYKRTIVANVIDGLVYAAITGAIFAWRWPHG